MHDGEHPSRVAVLLVLALFPLSSAAVFLALRTLPITLQWPDNVSDLAQLARELRGYSQSGPLQMLHFTAVLTVTAIWKHAWSIPGSVAWNLLAGALFPPHFATLLMTTLTALGSACAALLSMPLAPFLIRLFPKAHETTRNVLQGDHSTSPWVRLSILRLIGIVPWSGLNIACGICHVDMIECILGAFIGSLPWTAVTVQIGDILQTLSDTPTPKSQSISSLLLSPQIIFKLVFLSVLSLAPILAKDKLKALIPAPSSSPSTSSVSTLPAVEKDRPRRWSWSHIREKIQVSVSRSSSSERGRQSREIELNTLVEEKRALQDAEEGHVNAIS